jgi:c-di-GMP-binding flagellar brake protein YcgR
VEGWDETMIAKDRRKAQRLDAALPISISGEEGPAEGKTINISSNGVYFLSPRAIEPLTKVRMELMVPVQKGGKEEEMGVRFDGVVVRSQIDTSDPDSRNYRIAVFFTHVSQTSQKVLDSYIKRQLSI